MSESTSTTASKGRRSSKRSNPTTNVEDEDVHQERHATRKRARNVSQVCNVSEVHNPLIVPPFRQLRDEEIEYMDHIENELQLRGQSTFQTMNSPTLSGVGERVGVRHGKGKGPMTRMGVVLEWHEEEDSDGDEEKDDEGEDERGGGGVEEEELQENEEEVRDEYGELEHPIEGGPVNPELLKSFRGHVAYHIWHGKE